MGKENLHHVGVTLGGGQRKGSFARLVGLVHVGPRVQQGADGRKISLSGCFDQILSRPGPFSRTPQRENKDHSDKPKESSHRASPSQSGHFSVFLRAHSAILSFHSGLKSFASRQYFKIPPKTENSPISCKLKISVPLDRRGAGQRSSLLTVRPCCDKFQGIGPTFFPKSNGFRQVQEFRALSKTQIVRTDLRRRSNPTAFTRSALAAPPHVAN